MKDRGGRGSSGQSPAQAAAWPLLLGAELAAQVPPVFAAPQSRTAGEERGFSPPQPNSQPGEMPLQLGLDRIGLHVSWEGIPQAGLQQILMAPAWCQAWGHLDHLPFLPWLHQETPSHLLRASCSSPGAQLFSGSIRRRPLPPKNRQQPWGCRKDRYHRATAPAQAPAFKNLQFT